MITSTYVEGNVNMVFTDEEESSAVLVGDPLQLRESCLYEEILKYLDVKDILSLTEVRIWK